MGLKRRHKHKKNNNNNQKFDPQCVVKLDHKRKCYVVDEAPRFPLIATPRQLQKRYHYFSETESDESDNYSSSSSDDETYSKSLAFSETTEQFKDLIRMCSCSNDSGFEGGGTAPVNPKKMLGKLK